MSKNCWRLGLRSRPHLGAYSSSGPLTGFKGEKEEGKGEGGNWKRRGREWRKKRRRGKEERSSSHLVQCKLVRSLRLGKLFPASGTPGDLTWLEDFLTLK